MTAGDLVPLDATRQANACRNVGIDYELLKLRDSFHTDGFFKRESSMVNQLLAAAARSAISSRKRATGRSSCRR